MTLPSLVFFLGSCDVAVSFFLEGKADKQALLSLLWGDAEERD